MFRRKRHHDPIPQPTSADIACVIAGAEALLRRHAEPGPVVIAGIPRGALAVIHNWEGGQKGLVRLLADAFEVGHPTAAAWVRIVRAPR